MSEADDDDAVLGHLRRAVEVLATGAGPISARLRAAEPHFGRAFELDEWRRPIEQHLRLRIGASLVEGGDEEDSVGESIGSLDENRAVEIAGDILRLYELAAGIREDDEAVSFRAGRVLQRRTAAGKIPVTPRTLRKLLRLGWALRKADRAQDLDAERPDLVMFDERSKDLLEHARMLAAADREDQDAAIELAAAAKGHQRALRLAALGARQWGGHEESCLDNLAHRLLQAAIAETPVEAISGDQQRRLEQIDAFRELPSEAQKWRVLIERESRLAELELDARAGEFGLGGRALFELPLEEQKEAAAVELQGMMRLNEQLKPLVGPDASSADVILASHAAFEVAHGHLMRLYEPPNSD